MPKVKKKRRPKERVTLYEELRLVELSETEVNGIWKGAHLLLFFLAFVFGALCTFCFHMLMYMFDEKCVLFPKLLSLSGGRQNMLYDFMPHSKDKDDDESLPVDFVSTQWSEQSTCYLPTYVPLLSGLFGLVWTTMFLMCSSGGNSLSGLQRSWRIIPSVFIFSVLMSLLCTYASVMTQEGLQDMCHKLGEITGSKTCTYTVNVATLLYDRRIRGVYQAVKLTIMTAWLHTVCWILAALLALVRVLFVVDFGLVRIRAELQGDIDKMLERHEKHVKTVSPDTVVIKNMSTNTQGEAATDVSVIMHFKNETFDAEAEEFPSGYSALSLVPDEQHKLLKRAIFNSVSEDNKFIPELVYNLVDHVVPRESLRRFSLKLDNDVSEPNLLTRQKGREMLNQEGPSMITLSSVQDESDITSESKKSGSETLTPTFKTSKDENKPEEITKKTILKTRSIQTERKEKRHLPHQQKVQILESGDVTPTTPGQSSDETLKPDEAQRMKMLDFREVTHSIETQTGNSLVLGNEQEKNSLFVDENYKIIPKNATKKTSDLKTDNLVRKEKGNDVRKTQDYEKESKRIVHNDRKERITKTSETQNDEKASERIVKDDNKQQEIKTSSDEEVEAYKVYVPKKVTDQQTQVCEEDLKQEIDGIQVAETSEPQTQSSTKDDKNVQTKEKQD